MNTKKLQSYIVLKSLDTPLPDAFAGKIGEILPAFEIDVDEEGIESRGADILNGTYRQRISCNYLAPIKLWASKKQCQEQVLNITPRPYKPSTTGPLGESIESSDRMEGVSYYLIPFIRIAGVDDALTDCRNAWMIATGESLDEPEGYAIEKEMAEYYFDLSGDDLV